MSLVLPKEPVRALVASLTGVAPSRVVWSGEPEKTIGPVNGKAARITLNSIANAENGTIEPRRAFTDGPTPRQDIQWGAHRTVTISIRADCFLNSGEAYDMLETLRFKLGLPASRAALRAADLAFIDAPSIVQSRTADYVVDTRVVSSAILDIRVAFIACTPVEEDQDGWIEKVSHTNPPHEDIPDAPVVDLVFTRKP